LTLRTYPVKEGDAGNTILDVEVTLDRPASLQAQVNYATSDIEALAGLDYVATTGVLTIPVGATSGIVHVNIIGDVIKESNEHFYLNFSNPVNVVIDGDPRSRIMIIDDDKSRNNNITTSRSVDSGLPESTNEIPNITKRNHV